MIGELSPWHLLIVAVAFIVLFGSKKLPDASRSLGRSLRIFKSEMSDLKSDFKGEAEGRPAEAAAPQQPIAPAAPAAPVVPATPVVQDTPKVAEPQDTPAHQPKA